MRNAKIEQMVLQAMSGANPVEQDLVCRSLEASVEEGWEITGLERNMFGEVFVSLRPTVEGTNPTYKGRIADMNDLIFSVNGTN